MNTKRQAASLPSSATPLATALLISVGALLLSGCQEKASATEEATTSTKPSAQAMHESGSRSVSVSDNGSKFDPPVEAEKIPDGAWICDMNGQVRYASRTPGDGKCPVCSMKLVQKGSEQPTKHDGHMNHGEHMDHEGHDMHE